ncbi:hypothetical protein JZ751_002505 [Albula glossodonta]|uniref:Sorting nexin 14 n=1 Tax=Albula glossodonta TaxID=121402 RepID=A0A8T2NEP8_9TELE|nr:hypothetical protein JZ751_002505 [Albula glossodonta]
MSNFKARLENLKQRLKLDLFRELGRQYPVFCFLLLFLLLSTVLLNRYLHVLMLFWSFLAGVVTFYCSLGPETLLPNILFSIKPKSKQQDQQELFPLGHSCAVCGKIRCKRHSSGDQVTQQSVQMTSYWRERERGWGGPSVGLSVGRCVALHGSGSLVRGGGLQEQMANMAFIDRKIHSRLSSGEKKCVKFGKWPSTRVHCFPLRSLILWIRETSGGLPLDITDDEAFVDELRVTLRFFAAVLVRRAQKKRGWSSHESEQSRAYGSQPPKSTRGVVLARSTSLAEFVKNAEYLQQAALEEYGPDLHVALRSRRDELLYLRKLTEMLFPYILPPKASDCRSLTLLIREVLAGSVFLPSMDFLADPPEPATEPSSALVPFLQKYSDIRNKKSSVRGPVTPSSHASMLVLKLELKEIREQQDLLFRFMNFLKQEGAVHVLQFCLTVGKEEVVLCRGWGDVEGGVILRVESYSGGVIKGVGSQEFNDKILCPELSDSEMLMLHEEVKKIYETYCLEESVDKIRFDPFIVEEIRNIAEGPYTDVVRLQTMRCLFEAYEHVLSLLENVFTPMFCHSDEYFRQLLRGAESPARNSKLSRLV